MTDRVKFGRAWDIELGPIRVSSTDGKGQSFRCEFDVERDDSPTPNRATVKIYNLSREERKRILDVGKKVPVRIQAGYSDDYQLIYQGDLLRAFVRPDGQDYVLAAQSGEGNEAIRSAHVSKVFPKGSSFKEAITKIAEALGFESVVDKTLGAVNGSFADSWTSHGDAAFELTALLKGFGCRWYVDTGRVVMVKVNETGAATGIQIKTLLAPPELHLVKDKTTGQQIEVVRFSTVLEPRIFPGAIVELVDEFLGGVVLLRSVKFLGDTHGSNWFSECEGVFRAS